MIQRDDIADLVRRVDSEPGAAAELLRIAAGFLQSREPLPDVLADYLAVAFEAAAGVKPGTEGKPVEHERVRVLAKALGFTREAGGQRKEIPKDLALPLAVYGNELSDYQVANEIKRKHGISFNTALSRVKEMRDKIAEARKLLE
ncbi:MAG: hypothetical protein CVU18_17105 [Betaproteobacteria bacterium HGW-Betaproteobacteria-12]|nr:MAG: hypothetical protein CVU18_17105 [Betaproteobacteria bacterium HGW-Betaproteobacteria-12]